MSSGMPSVTSVLVACEMSGRVRTAFAKRDWRAVSADLLPDESAMWNDEPAGEHYQGDVRDIIEDDWDLVIGHPPCTDLSQAGARYWKQKQADGRQQAAIDFFRELYHRPQGKAFVVLENPKGILAKEFRVPDQVIEPWWFGDPYQKKTCLWYRSALGYRDSSHQSPFTPYFVDLPRLIATNPVEPTGRVTTGGGSYRTDKARGLTGMNRAWEDSQGRARRHILRSLTLPGIAQAFADQWGPLIEALRG